MYFTVVSRPLRKIFSALQEQDQGKKRNQFKPSHFHSIWARGDLEQSTFSGRKCSKHAIKLSHNITRYWNLISWVDNWLGLIKESTNINNNQKIYMNLKVVKQYIYIYIYIIIRIVYKRVLDPIQRQTT